MHTTMSQFAVGSKDMVVSTLFIGFLSLALPLTLMQVYDRILIYGAVDSLTWLIVGSLVAVVLEGILRITRSFISGFVAARFEHLVGREAVDRFLYSETGSFLRTDPSTHLERLGAIGTLRSFYAGQIFQTMLDLPFALLFLAAIAYLSGILVFVPIGLILLFFVIVFYLNQHFEMARNQQIAHEEGRTNFVIELLGRIHEIKALSMEEMQLRRYENFQALTADANLKVSFWNTLPGTLGAMFSNMALFGVLGFGASRVVSGDLTLGALTACSLLSARAMQPVQNLAGFLTQFSEARIALSRLNTILSLSSEQPSDAAPFPKTITGSLELQDVSFRYEPDRPLALQNVSLSILSGSTICIHGASLSGSTTLLYTMMGMLKPNEGRVLIDGQDLKIYDQTDLHGQMAYVPQTAPLYNGTLLENLTMFDAGKNDIVFDVARRLDFDRLVATLPLGYETVMNPQSQNLLPGSIIQRLGLVRALTTKPKVLLLDKTTEALDRESQDIMRVLVGDLKGKCTLVMVTNQPNFLRLADDVYELVAGQLETSMLLELLDTFKNTTR